MKLASLVLLVLASVCAASAPPASFDGRKVWGSCVQAVRSQGSSCLGASFAFSATAALGERFCISRQANTTLSPQWVLSCDLMNMGCKGGFLSDTWSFMVNYGGAVAETCLPYSAAAGNVTACPTTCTGGAVLRHFWAGKGYQVAGFDPFGRIDRIENEIAAHGPVTAGIKVYEDLLSFTGSGVYTHSASSSKHVGDGAVEVVGWGASGSTAYWIVKGSFGDSWGENGFAKIEKGKNLIGIEGDVWAGTPGFIQPQQGATSH